MSDDENNKYKRGKIYKIVDNTDMRVYIGSTTQTLTKRLITHRVSYKAFKQGNKKRYYSSHEVMKNGDYTMTLIENYPCNSREELSKRERYFIENTDNVVNIRKSYSSEEETREKAKIYGINYRKENNESLREYAKKYIEENKEYYKNKNKKYYQDNKDKIIEINKKRYIESKENLLQKNTCICGAVVCNSFLKNHKKTIKHIVFENCFIFEQLPFNLK